MYAGEETLPPIFSWIDKSKRRPCQEGDSRYSLDYAINGLNIE